MNFKFKSSHTKRNYITRTSRRSSEVKKETKMNESKTKKETNANESVEVVVQDRLHTKVTN